MIEGPTDTTTVGLKLQLCRLSFPRPVLSIFFFCFLFFFRWLFLFCKNGRDCSHLGWVLSSFFLLFEALPPHHYHHHLFLTALHIRPLSSTSLLPPLCLYVPIMLVFKVHLLPFASLCFPCHHLQSSLQQCHTRDENVCVTNDAGQCIQFQYRKTADFIWRLFFLCSGLNVARNTNLCLCVRTCIQIELFL